MTTSEAEAPSRLAQAVIEYLTRSVDHPFATLVKAEGLVLDVEVEPELAQDRVVPILPVEPLRLIFSPGDTSSPIVLSRRADFPFGLVHTLQGWGESGLALCVWEEAWQDISRMLTGQVLVERLRDWLSRTAAGSLHQEEQGLEPLIPTTAHTLIIPPGPPRGPWHIVGASKHDGRWTVRLDPTPRTDVSGVLPFAVFGLELPSQVHAALRARPYDLGSLIGLARELGGNLVASLGEWLVEPAQLEHAVDRHVLLLVSVPKRRTLEGPDETVEVWAYQPSGTLADLGEQLGHTFTYREGAAADTVRAMPPGSVADLGAIELQGWRVVQRLDRTSARDHAAVPNRSDAKLVAIGAGAIGSNVVLNTAKSGIGAWTIIDDDVVLPHNTVRQAYGDALVGFSKAEALAHEVNQLLAEADAKSHCADVLRSDAQAEDLAQADLVLDFSASPAVVGHLSDQREVRRAASFFFSPDGSDLVILAEDAARELRLDEIEAQYFLAVATEPSLAGHLDTARVDRIRYANACQDLTRPLPPWQVQSLCGIAAGQLIALVGSPKAAASIWRLDPANAAVAPVMLPLSQVHRHASADLRVVVTEAAMKMIQGLRAAAVPNETGGVLVGTFDVVRGVAHIVAALSAPPDSRQAPTHFVRGARDLRPIVEGMAARTAGRLHYLGEWHSHPDRVAARPSGDDEKVFAYLAKHLHPGGAPYAMMIHGERDTWLRVGWQGRATLEGTMAHATERRS
ncbi:ThiF family adenylyltransferase [Paracoccus endophyticus]|uniref:ThiF family adenylyltransferase n=1 Tax=Paracoccus endophyticus TaxID=2233774 RepID=UPI000DD796D7|nr:ThiF family adenylyltransferase [Paracoccus endophyticus]